MRLDNSQEKWSPGKEQDFRTRGDNSWVAKFVLMDASFVRLLGFGKRIRM